METNMIETATDFANHAAGKDDRYLLIVTGFALFAAFAIAIRWLVGRMEKSDTKLEALIERGHVLSERIAQVVERNSEALDRSVEAVKESNAVIQHCKARNNL